MKTSARVLGAVAILALLVWAMPVRAEDLTPLPSEMPKIDEPICSAGPLPGNYGFFGQAARGLINMIIAPLDIIATTERVCRETENPVIGLTYGPLEGVVNGLARESMGIVELIDAPVPGKSYPLYWRELGERSIREDVWW